MLSKPCHSGEKIQVGISHRGGPLLLNGWQEAAMDLSKPPGELGIGGETGPVGHITHAVHTPPPPPPPHPNPHPPPPPPHKLPNLSSMQGSLGLDMAGILQAGLIHPVTGQIVNGSLRRDDFMRRRRGRRRNVDGPDISFIRSHGLSVSDQQVGLTFRSDVRTNSCKMFAQNACWVWVKTKQYYCFNHWTVETAVLKLAYFPKSVML